MVAALKWLSCALAATGVQAQDLAQLPRYQPEGHVSGTIRLTGHGSFKSDFMGRLVRAWAAGFAKYQPDVQLENHMYGTASAIGWEGNHQGVVTCLGGTFYVLGRINTNFGFGIYSGTPTTWTLADGYLPAQITTFRRSGATVTITEFADRVVIGNHAYVAVYCRVFRPAITPATNVPSFTSRIRAFWTFQPLRSRKALKRSCAFMRSDFMWCMARAIDSPSLKPIIM